MRNSRKLALRKETLTELSGPDLRVVAGARASIGPIGCHIAIEQLPTESCVTCVDTLTVATCACPTGASCPCPTAGC
jgi:hypothetical protein